MITSPPQARGTRFPRYPPFGGAFTDVIRHLTIGDRPMGGPGVLRAAGAEVLAGLPNPHPGQPRTGTQAPDSWQLRDTFPLGT